MEPITPADRQLLNERPEAYIGCCGAHCKTCRPFLDGQCRGCKLGYDSGVRDLGKARCAMKRCCLARELDTCAECPDFTTCSILSAFHNKKGYKYGRYRQSIEFIRNYGSAEFIRQAESWTGAYGRLQEVL